MDSAEMHNRIHEYWKEHSNEIENATDGYYYIMKMLYKALSFNAMAANTAVTVSSAMNKEAERHRQYYTEVSSDSIAAAICELMVY